MPDTSRLSRRPADDDVQTSWNDALDCAGCFRPLSVSSDFLINDPFISCHTSTAVMSLRVHNTRLLAAAVDDFNF